MWEPISVFCIMWALNAGLPCSRLSVHEVQRANEKQANSIVINKLNFVKESATVI